ncbi:carbohydrate-binding module family 21 [Fusarium flagelliforme]|uniref:Carbohydrate-binding module family 21 n=2 Tax=Fusarium flagelliforme TaxID=2675880 RepID=A0A395M577_9HYPO|nr:carbohydrate-binding module family 21 [Fusarium flagelliforme]
MEASVVTSRGLATTLRSGHLTQRYAGVDSKRVGSLIPPYSQLDDPNEQSFPTNLSRGAMTTVGLKESSEHILRLRSLIPRLDLGCEGSMRKRWPPAKRNCLPPLSSSNEHTQMKQAAFRQKPCLNLQRTCDDSEKTINRLPKTVHFDQDLEHICFFLKTDQPSIVAISPCYVADNPRFYDNVAGTLVPREPEWDMSTPNFPEQDSTRREMPVRVQRVFFSGRRNVLVIFVVVVDLASEKFITCYFTRDCWKTVSETPAQYYRASSGRDGLKYEKFVMSIAFPRDDDLDSGPLLFRVRYSVNKEEFWDNNSGMNFEVYFHRRAS